MTKEQKVTEMFDNISSTYDKTNTFLSLGLDKSWRKMLVRSLPKKKRSSLLDVATGTGEVLLEAFKQNRIEMGVGLDLSTNMLKIARAKFENSPYKPVCNFIEGSALKLPFEDQSFDAVTMAYGIRNVQNVSVALMEMRRVLKPGGRILILEFSLPKNTWLKQMHLLYLRRIVPYLGGRISKSRSSYVYLNETIESFPYGSGFVKMLQQAGFDQCTSKPILGGITTLYAADKL